MQRELLLQFLPVFVNAEVPLKNLRIVKQHDGILCQLSLPVAEIPLYVFVEMPAVYMQQIDASIAKIRQRFFEGGFVYDCMAFVTLQVLQKGFIKGRIKKTCMLVTLPMIQDRKSTRLN